MDSCKQSDHKCFDKRRMFLKKAVYHAPVLYILATLVAPASLEADASGVPPGPPGGGAPFGSSAKAAPPRRKTLRF